MATPNGFIPNRKTWERLTKSVRRTESALVPRVGRAVEPPRVRGAHHNWVAVTDATLNGDGFYPGVWCQFNAADNTFTDGEGIWIRPVDGGKLYEGRHYWGRLEGPFPDDDVSIYGVGWPSFGGARVTNNSGFAIPDAVDTAIEFVTTIYDTDAYFSGGDPTRLAVPADGYYEFSYDLGYTSFAAAATIRSRMELNASGSVSGRSTVFYNGSTAVDIGANGSTGPVLLVAGDYVEVKVLHDMGSDLDLEGSRFSVERIDP